MAYYSSFKLATMLYNVTKDYWSVCTQKCAMANRIEITVITGLDKQNISSVKLYFFSYPSVLTYIVAAQKNRLNETVLLRTHSVCFA